MIKFLFILMVVLLGMLFFRSVTNQMQDTDPSSSPVASASTVPSPAPSPVASAHPYSDLIVVDVPQSGAVISSPLTITGKARGPWYFEASFSVRLLDEQGRVIVEGPAQAQGEWMTEEFVPFIAKLEFIRPSSNAGVLVIENANPSGLPDQAKTLEIPVTFQ